MKVFDIDKYILDSSSDIAEFLGRCSASGSGLMFVLMEDGYYELKAKKIAACEREYSEYREQPAETHDE